MPARGGSVSTTAGRAASSSGQQPLECHADVADLEDRVLDAVAGRVVTGRVDGFFLRLDAGHDSGAARQRQAQRADAAVEVERRPRGVRFGEAQRRLVELVAHDRVGLQEPERRYVQRNAGQCLAQVRRSVEHEWAHADGRVGRSLVDGDAEAGEVTCRAQALEQILLLRRAPADEQVDEQIAAGQAAADHQVTKRTAGLVIVDLVAGERRACAPPLAGGVLAAGRLAGGLREGVEGHRCEAVGRLPAAPALAPVRPQAEVSARLDDGGAGGFDLRRRQPAPVDFDDLTPGAAPVQAEKEPPSASSPNEYSILLR